MRRWLLWFAFGLAVFVVAGLVFDRTEPGESLVALGVTIVFFAWCGVTAWAAFLGGVRWLIGGRGGRG